MAVHVAIKFCGLTRAEDVAAACELDAEYVGVIMAGGPRNRSLAEAHALLAECDDVRRVGVVRADATEEFAAIVSSAVIDIMQLHADPQTSAIDAAYEAGITEVWPVTRIEGSNLPDVAAALLRADGVVVLDTKSPSGLGGTGTSFDWDAIADLPALRQRRSRIVLAGGLNSRNVGAAIRALGPDVVDVSSGVESAPGVKDHAEMRRFADAVRSA